MAARPLEIAFKTSMDRSLHRNALAFRLSVRCRDQGLDPIGSTGRARALLLPSKSGP
jgi:hypothetical protein